LGKRKPENHPLVVSSLSLVFPLFSSPLPVSPLTLESTKNAKIRKGGVLSSETQEENGSNVNPNDSLSEEEPEEDDEDGTLSQFARSREVSVVKESRVNGSHSKEKEKQDDTSVTSSTMSNVKSKSYNPLKITTRRLLSWNKQQQRHHQQQQQQQQRKISTTSPTSLLALQSEEVEVKPITNQPASQQLKDSSSTNILLSPSRSPPSSSSASSSSSWWSPLFRKQKSSSSDPDTSCSSSHHVAEVIVASSISPPETSKIAGLSSFTPEKKKPVVTFEGASTPNNRQQQQQEVSPKSRKPLKRFKTLVRNEIYSYDEEENIIKQFYSTDMYDILVIKHHLGEEGDDYEPLSSSAAMMRTAVSLDMTEPEKGEKNDGGSTTEKAKAKEKESKQAGNQQQTKKKGKKKEEKHFSALAKALFLEEIDGEDDEDGLNDDETEQEKKEKELTRNFQSSVDRLFDIPASSDPLALSSLDFIDQGGELVSAYFYRVNHLLQAVFQKKRRSVSDEVNGREVVESEACFIENYFDLKKKKKILSVKYPSSHRNSNKRPSASLTAGGVSGNRRSSGNNSGRRPSASRGSRTSTSSASRHSRGLASSSSSLSTAVGGATAGYHHTASAERFAYYK
jgi:hypothetical protein